MIELIEKKYVNSVYKNLAKIYKNDSIHFYFEY